MGFHRAATDVPSARAARNAAAGRAFGPRIARGLRRVGPQAYRWRCRRSCGLRRYRGNASAPPQPRTSTTGERNFPSFALASLDALDTGHSYSGISAVKSTTWAVLAVAYVLQTQAVAP